MFAVVQRDEFRREENAEGILAVILVDHVDGMIGQNDGRTAVTEVHQNGQAAGAAKLGRGGVTKKTEGRGGLRRQRVRGVHVGADGELRGGADGGAVEQGFDGYDLRLVSANVDPTLDRQRERIAGGVGERRIEGEFHRLMLRAKRARRITSRHPRAWGRSEGEIGELEREVGVIGRIVF